MVPCSVAKGWINKSGAAASTGSALLFCMAMGTKREEERGKWLMGLMFRLRERESRL